MKNISVLMMILFIQTGLLKSQKLQVNEVFQEKSYWDWAAVSQCILDYYGFPVDQCEMAEYIRISGWHKPEERSCCDAVNDHCNFSTALSEIKGSVQDILLHFGGISSTLIHDSLSWSEIKNETDNGRPFIIRWEMPGQLSHFLVGYGIKNQTVYYVDPAAGEGLKTASHNWLKYDGHHIWTHTLVLSTMPTLIDNDLYDNIEAAQFFPNPAHDRIRICLNKPFSDQYEVEVYDVFGNLVLKRLQEKGNREFEIEVSNYLPGMYIMHAFNQQRRCAFKFVKQ
ncbi:MAG: T9SS type A sorting domain-containing protein [Bacteroidales bacterium]|nr:T9SS type A sorting domain-containing protein [Bacteroidales bacterium]